MATQEEIAQAIRQFIIDNTFEGKDEPKLTNETPLISSRIMDSIVALKLVSHLESKFGFEFEAHEVTQENLESIAVLTAFVQSKLK
jgi:acyl carrier protein